MLKVIVLGLLILLMSHIGYPLAKIRDLRKQYGYETILDRWIIKTKTETKNGKKYKVTQRYKQYFLNKLDGVA